MSVSDRRSAPPRHWPRCRCRVSLRRAKTRLRESATVDHLIATRTVISSRQGSSAHSAATSRRRSTAITRTCCRSASAGNRRELTTRWRTGGSPSSIATASRVRWSSRACRATRPRSRPRSLDTPIGSIGAFMFNPAAPDAAGRLDRAFDEHRLATVCLFPAMHRMSAGRRRGRAVFAAAGRHRRAVFVHCGVLSVGVRKKLGLPSRFDLRLGDPLGRGGRGRASSGRARRDSALRRRALSRSADGRRRRAEHPARHLELERLDPAITPASRCATSSRARSTSSVRAGCCSAPTRRSSRAAGNAASSRPSAPSSIDLGVDAAAQVAGLWW